MWWNELTCSLLNYGWPNGPYIMVSSHESIDILSESQACEPKPVLWNICTDALWFKFILNFKPAECTWNKGNRPKISGVLGHFWVVGKCKSKKKTWQHLKSRSCGPTAWAPHLTAGSDQCCCQGKSTSPFSGVAHWSPEGIRFVVDGFIIWPTDMYTC